jgi:hypothetical protein
LKAFLEETAIHNKQYYFQFAGMRKKEDNGSTRNVFWSGRQVSNALPLLILLAIEAG